MSGSVVYVGGDFGTIGGASRARIAAIDAAGTGSATGWNPGANTGSVVTISVSGSTVYAGGTFTSIDGQPRKYLAALDATTGSATAWDPNPNNGPGPHQVSFDARGLPSGLYVCRLRVGGRMAEQRMVVMR